MLDVTDFVTSRGGDPEKIRQSQRKRYAPTEVVDEIIAIWDDHRRTQYGADQIGGEMNAIQKSIAQKKKSGESIEELLLKKDELQQKRKAQEELAAEKMSLLYTKLKTVGNYVHESVPVSNTEDDNVVIRQWAPDAAEAGAWEKVDNLLSHHQVLTRLGGFDPERGAKLAGHRGYCLVGYGLFLFVIAAPFFSSFEFCGCN
jgi:seryl-tRNA synthetase